jgi:hypothetical protein
LKKYLNSFITFLIGYILSYFFLTLSRFIVYKDKYFLLPKQFESSILILFIAFSILVSIMIIGLGFRNFFSNSNILLSRRHLLLLTISIAVIINYLTLGNHQTLLSGNIVSNLFDITFYCSILTLLGIVLIPIVQFVRASRKKTDLTQMADFLDDDPTTEDILNRKTFADSLSEIITNHRGKITIGIYGPWGTGKSSFLEMIKEALPKDQLYLHFTPWYFGENNHLIITKFLDQFAEEMKKSSNYNTELEKEIKKYTTFIKSISYKQGAGTYKIGDLFQGFLPEDSNLSSSKKELTEMLKKSDRQIVVFIDDLDRLEKDEIIMVFKLVRLVCDFPNVVYVLALDEEVVSLALGHLFDSEDDKLSATARGRKYLEKFIQVPIYLPKAEDKKLLAYLLNGVEKLLIEEEIESYFLQENRSIYPIIDVSGFQLTIRNIKRYINLIRVFVPLLKKEVFVDDLLYLLLIKVTSPGLYDWIRNHSQSLFVGNMNKTSINELVVSFPNYIRIMEELFPNISQTASQSSRANKIIQNSHLAISNPSYFEKYFLYTTPDKEVSQTEIGAFLRLVSSENLDVQVRELYRLVNIFNAKEIFLKIEHNTPSLHIDELHGLILLLSKVFVKTTEDDMREKIVRVLLNIYKLRTDGFLSSSLFEKPYNFALLIHLAETIDHFSGNREAVVEVHRLVDRELSENMLSQLLGKIPANEKYIFIDFWVKSGKNFRERRKSLSNYITDFKKFEEVILVIQSNYGKMEDINFYLFLLKCIEKVTMETYLAQYENDNKLTEHTGLFNRILLAESHVFKQFELELEDIIQSAQKNSIPPILNRNYRIKLDPFIEVYSDDERLKTIKGLLENFSEE